MMDLVKLTAQLTRHEGRRRLPYVDTVGKTSIGVGRNLTDVGLFEDEIDLLLENDIARTWGGLRHALPWVDRLDEVRQRALVDFGFVGVETVLTFHQTLDALRTQDWTAAAEHLLQSKYARQVGPRAVDLATMFRTGTDPV